MKVVLASQSPRRRELLEAQGIAFDVVVSEVDERLSEEELADPAAAACLLADRKAGVVAQELLRSENPPAEETMVIGADTMVVLGGRIFGKPVSASDAVGMLRKLSGTTHQVITGVSVWGIMPAGDGNYSMGHSTFHESSSVTFRELAEDEIAAYVGSGECFDKAGSYAIQGAGGQFVASYDGPLDNIIGLPVQRLAQMFPDLVP